MRILLLKPYQPTAGLINSPPLGLLYLIAMLRQQFGSRIHIDLLDMKSHGYTARWMQQKLGAEYAPDIVGISALNYEGGAAHQLARIFKEYDSNIITVLGGPYALHRAEEILQKGDFDWVFSGAADKTLPMAISRLLTGQELGTDIHGFSYRCNENLLHINLQQENIQDLDNLPMPAWDLVDFDRYARQANMMNMLRGKKYATLFTSRGCPYLCNYCHDIFSKKFVYRSVDNVLEEIKILYETYGVDEFEIVDDIFNLHKPRLKEIMSEVSARWPGKLSFCFPNGLRADILDEEVLDALKDGGSYAINIAIETVTPRLQTLIEKHLDIGKTKWAIDACDKRGIVTGGFFMLGFPTETETEIKNTIAFALSSKLTIAHFFIVVPQKETPMYEFAMREGAAALMENPEESVNDAPYYSPHSWYQLTYGIPLNRLLALAIIRFYFSPHRIWKIWSRVPKKSIFQSALKLLGIVFRLGR